MRLVLGLIALALLGSVAGCGDDDEVADGPAGTAGPAPPASRVSLDVRVDPGEGEALTASLRCDGDSAAATGFLERRDAAELCRSAVRLRELLTEPPPEDQVCTQIYGGPQTARFTGSIAGERVDRRFSRQNGCRIGEWDRLAEAGLLPAA